MKVRSWLYTSAAIMLGGLVALSGISVYAIHDIRGIIAELTDRSTPLQIKTTELQRSIEALTGVLMRLGGAADKTEAAELTAAVELHLAGVKSAVEGIKTLDAAKAGAIDVSVISGVYQDVKQATDGRIKSLGNFQQESRKVDEAILLVDRSLASVRQDMQTLSASGAKQVGDSVNSSAQMLVEVQQVKDLVLYLKEVQLIIKDLEDAKNLSQILVNKSKLKSTNITVQAISVNDPTVIGVKKALAEIFQQLTRPETGLFALKQGALAGKDVAGKFVDEQRQVNNRLLELAGSLGAFTGQIEKHAGQNRRNAEASLAASQRIAGIDTAVNGITFEVKTLEVKVRSLMLSGSVQEANQAAAETRAIFDRIARGEAQARGALMQLKQSAALRNVDAAAGAVRGASASVEQIITAQMKIIESNEKAKKAIEMVKGAANRELKNGEELVKDTASLQKGMVDKTNQASARMSATIITMALVIAFCAALPLWYTIRRVNLSLTRVTAMVSDIAQGEGDLTKRLDESGKDEFAELSRWFNLFLHKLNGILCQVAGNTHELTSSASSMKDASTSIAGAADAVAAQGVTAATASEEMAATAADIANNCQKVAENARGADVAAQSGVSVVRETLVAMEQIVTTVRSSAGSVVSLGERGDEIGVVIATIEDIADQTNLLALNAAIEAARAGDQGRGFAVVADEVRALAERTTQATHDIGGMIRCIQLETRQAVRSMEEGVRQAELGSERAAGSGEALREILQQIASLNLQIEQIATAAEEQTATTHEINVSVQRMTEEVRGTAEGAQSAAAAAARQSQLAFGLEQLVGQFKLVR